MKVLLIVLCVGLVCAALLAIYARNVDIPTATWNVVPENEAVTSPRFPVSAQDLLVAFNGIVLATPRTQVLAGSVDTGLVTYVTRSRIWGFPDVTSVRAQDVEGGSQLLIYARPRIGDYDWGVNGKRVNQWLMDLKTTLSP